MSQQYYNEIIFYFPTILFSLKEKESLKNRNDIDLFSSCIETRDILPEFIELKTTDTVEVPRYIFKSNTKETFSKIVQNFMNCNCSCIR